MTDDENDPRFQHEAATMYQKVVEFCKGKPLTAHTVRAIEQIIYDSRLRAKIHGVQLPDLVVLPLRNRAGESAVEMTRRDLEDSGIETVMVNIYRKYQGQFEAIDLARAINYGYPHYKISRSRELIEAGHA